MDQAQLLSIAKRLQASLDELWTMTTIQAATAEPLLNPIQKFLSDNPNGSLLTYQTFNPARGSHGLSEQEKQWAREAGLTAELGGFTPSTGDSPVLKERTFIGKQPGQFVILELAANEVVQIPFPGQMHPTQFEFSVVPGAGPTDIHNIRIGFSTTVADPSLSLSMLGGYINHSLNRMPPGDYVIAIKPDAAVKLHVRYSF